MVPKVDTSIISKLTIDEEIKPAASKEVEVVPIVKEVIEKTIEKPIEKPIDVIASPVPSIVNNTKESSFRLTNLPRHDKDFATDWFYSTQRETVAEDIVIEYNAYLQTFEELERGEIVLPEGFDGTTIANDIRNYVLQDFRRYDVKLNTKDNLAHRAYYCHCIKRALDSLKQGEFTGPDGYTKKKPEIADALEARINKIIFDKMMGK